MLKCALKKKDGVLNWHAYMSKFYFLFIGIIVYYRGMRVSQEGELLRYLIQHTLLGGGVCLTIAFSMLICLDTSPIITPHSAIIKIIWLHLKCLSLMACTMLRIAIWSTCYETQTSLSLKEKLSRESYNNANLTCCTKIIMKLAR